MKVELDIFIYDITIKINVGFCLKFADDYMRHV